MKFTSTNNNFGSGEWSPRMKGRSDVAAYPNACELMYNMIPQMTGGAEFRGGTEQIPILDSTARTYFQNLLSGFLPALPGTCKLISYTSSGGGLSDQVLSITGGFGSYKWYVLPLGTEPTIGAGSTGVSSYSLGPSSHVQVGDLVIFAGLNGPPKVFTGTVVTDMDIYLANQGKKPWKAFPWGDLNAFDSNVTITAGATANTVGSPVGLTSSAPFFTASMVGSYVRLCNGTALDGVVKITTFTNSTTVVATVMQVLPNTSFTYGSTTNSTSFWQQSQWYSGNWPRTVTAHQGRLIFGGSTLKPDTLWGSRISNIFDFEEIPSPNTTGVFGFASNGWIQDNSRPFTLTPNTSVASSIVALSSSKTLVINTAKAEIVAYGSNGALGPNNAQFESSTSFGAAPVTPVRVNNYLTFVQGNGAKLRDVVFNFEQDQYKSNDLSFTSEHLFTQDFKGYPFNIDPIVSMTKVENKSSVLFALTSSGLLRCVTLDRDYNINGWARIVLGVSGLQGISATPAPVILSICSAYNHTIRQQRLHLLVLRVINGVPTISYEVMTQAWNGQNPYTSPSTMTSIKPVYLDMSSYATNVGAVPTTTWKTSTAIYNLYRGEFVSVVADGNYIGELEVSNDSDATITLPYAASTVLVGYKYLGQVTTFPIEPPSKAGTPVARYKAVDEASVRFDNSIGCLVGFSEDTLEDIPMRDPSQPMNQAVEFFTGSKVLTWPAGYEREYKVIIRQDKPYPMHIVSVAAHGMTYD